MNIIFDLSNATKKQKILYPWAGALKAGTPLAGDGSVANDGSAVGLVAHDYPEEWAKEVYPDGKFYAEVEVIAAGYIDLAAAEANCGLTYSDELKAALTGIVFCDGALPAPDVLPAIEESDEGKVLTVDEGAAVWAEASGGGGADVVIRLNVEEGDVVSITTIRTLDLETLLEKYANDPSSVSVFVYAEDEAHKITPRVSVLICEPYTVDEIENVYVYILAYDMFVVQTTAPVNSSELVFTDEGWVFE